MDNTNLTTIAIPFGLLDTDTQEALRSHEGVIEVYTNSGHWVGVKRSIFNKAFTYRARPEPKILRRGFSIYGDMVSVLVTIENDKIVALSLENPK